MWDQSIYLIFAIEAYIALFALLLTLNVFFYPDESVFDIILLIVLTPMFVVEIWEIKVWKKSYFTDLWNIIDLSRVIICYWFLISAIVGYEYDVDVENAIKASALMLSWLRLTSLFRCF